MDRRLKIIGWYQILGGFGGLLIFAITLSFTIYQIGFTSELNELFLFFVIAVGLFIFSIHCGKLLLSSATLVLGVKRSFINQILQVFTISLFGYTYQYYAGPQLSFGLDLTSQLTFKFDFSLLGSQFTYGNNSNEIFVMINVIPLFVIHFLNQIETSPEQVTAEAKLKNSLDN